jgi:HECT-domain (ubiquitin-transferase)
VQIKDFTGNASDLGLYFVVEEDVLGQRLEHELIHNGSEVPVTDSTKLMYVYLCAHWHILRISGAASQAFARGLSKVVPISFLRMFTTVEVNEVRRCRPPASPHACFCVQASRPCTCTCTRAVVQLVAQPATRAAPARAHLPHARACRFWVVPPAQRASMWPT